MTDVPNGSPIPMDQFTLGPRFDAVRLARECGCRFCRKFLATYERRMATFTDTITDVLKAADLSVTVRRWPDGL
jgi:hypothetical protein